MFFSCSTLEILLGTKLNLYYQLAKEDLLLLKIDQYIDFSFIVDKVKAYYSEIKGRPSLDPLIL
ncbi:hypothetical protein [Bacillus pumilus]|uniref:hypothetical protein n=1 Tax=Bacillus pumilus TaxID=1408 RepID=UPI003DA2F3BB